MKKLFVAGVDGLSEDKKKEFLEYVKDRRLGWWSWIPNFWLLVGNNDGVTVQDLRDKLRELSGHKNVLVLQVQEVTWSGYGPKTDDRDMFSWIHRNWSKD